MALKKNLDELVFDQMRDRIINGEWEQGDILNVDELSADYEVSRTPVLQALKRMHSEGLLEFSRVGKYFIPTYTAKQVEDICRVRLLLELEALDQIQRNDLYLNLSALRQITMNCHQETLRGEVVTSRRFDLELHKLLVLSAQNDCLAGIYTQVQGQFMIANYLQVFHTKQQQLIAADDHIAILECLEHNDFDGAKKRLTDHINQAHQKIKARINSANV